LGYFFIWLPSSRHAGFWCVQFRTAIIDFGQNHIPASIRLSNEYGSTDVIQAHRQLISRAHARGVKLIGATMTPCEGVAIPGYYSESKDAVRQAINKWIRTSGSFDGVIDFDAVLRDPDHPGRILPRVARPSSSQ
jgi:hypothetical protein